MSLIPVATGVSCGNTLEDASDRGKAAFGPEHVHNGSRKLCAAMAWPMKPIMRTIAILKARMLRRDSESFMEEANSGSVFAHTMGLGL